MKIVGICEKIEFAVGFRLSGIDCKILKDDNLLKKIEEIAKDSNIGIIIVTDSLYQKSQKEINEFRRKNKFPLIVNLSSKTN